MIFETDSHKDKDIMEDYILQPEVLVVAEQRYWKSSETLDAQIALRNLTVTNQWVNPLLLIGM